MKNLNRKIIHLSTLAIFSLSLFVACGKNQDGPGAGQGSQENSKSSSDSKNSTQLAPSTGCTQFMDGDSVEAVAVKAHKARVECQMSEEDIALQLKR